MIKQTTFRVIVRLYYRVCVNEMSVQQTGLAYLFTYSGIINVIEQIVNVTIVTLLALAGYETSGSLLNAVAIFAFICTALLIVFQTYGITKKTKLPWYWIEFVYTLITAILFAIFSSWVLMNFTTYYVITGLIGYGQAVLYVLDMFDKHHWATKPTPKYAWTTPNMPDLE